MNWIKQRWFLLVLNTFCALLLWGQSPERPKKEIPLITDVISTIKNAEGWMLQNNGEWVSAQNKIPFKQYSSNKRKGGKYNLGEENFEHIDIRSITINNKVYSVMLIFSQGGNYEFPVLEETWRHYSSLTYYVFEEDKWNQIFPDSVSFNNPYAVNTEIVCTNVLVDYSDKSYLFEIENHIRQAIYQQEESTSNLIFAAYPVKIRDKTFFRFKFYETINKPEIYVKFLLKYNWVKLFRNFYYETDFKDFAEFVNNIGVIDPTKINNTDYYLHFLEWGKAKFDQEEYRSALQSFVKAGMVNPPDTGLISILLWKGKAKLHLNAINEALQDFDSAIVRTPSTITEKSDWIMTHYERGSAYYKLHEYSHACEDWNFSLQNGVEDAYNKIKKNCGKSSGGMEYAIDIEKSDKLFDKATKQYNEKNYLKALHFFEQSWRYNHLSQDFKLPYYIGVCRYDLGDYVRCIDEFDQAAVLMPEQFSAAYDHWTDVFVMRGKAWHKIGFDDYACEDWMEAKNHGNEYAFELYADYCGSHDANHKPIKQSQASSLEDGMTDYEAGDYAQAIEALNQVAENSADSSNMLLYTYRASAKHKSGDLEGAIQDFTKAIALGIHDQSNYNEWVNAYFNRGVSYYLSGNTDQACKDWHKAMDMGLNDLYALKYIYSYCK